MITEETPIGVYIVSIYLGIQGISAFRELYEAGINTISSSPFMSGAYVVVGLGLIGIATSIWERRPIGLFGGLFLGGCMIIVYGYQTVVGGSWNIVGVIISLVIVAYLFSRRHLFLDHLE